MKKREKLFNEITKAISGIPEGAIDKQLYLSKARRLYKSCGCKFGAAVMMIVFILFPFWYILTQAEKISLSNNRFFLQWLGYTFLATLTAKLFALAVTFLEMKSLYKMIKRKILFP
ncbi:hypothetical protein [Foetidibacter luteolus]|uniref:hypothetical protein n=1 Tax=Foetidibacter luteolus TaxID=2608880 RepID=UPI00129AE0A0|nr:hypothetical protein [Foetidibacter luteolus]